MIFFGSYILLGALLVTESLILAHVLRGTVRAALSHEARQASPIDLPFENPVSSGPGNPDAGDFRSG